MEEEVLFIGYPKCSTCQKAEKFLRTRGCMAPMRDIVTEKPTAEELRVWHERSGLPLKRFFNTSGMLPRTRAEGQAAHDDRGGAIRRTRLGRDARQASAAHHA